MATLKGCALFLVILQIFIYCTFGSTCVDDPTLTEQFESMAPYTSTFGCCSAYIEPHNTSEWLW
eukprot:UN00303